MISSSSKSHTSRSDLSLSVFVFFLRRLTGDSITAGSVSSASVPVPGVEFPDEDTTGVLSRCSVRAVLLRDILQSPEMAAR